MNARIQRTCGNSEDIDAGRRRKAECLPHCSIVLWIVVLVVPTLEPLEAQELGVRVPRPLNEAKLLLNEGRYEEALQRFQSIPHSSPAYRNALVGRAIVNIARHQPEAALPLLDELCQQSPLEADWHKLRAVLLLLLGRSNAESALISLAEAQKLNPQDDEVPYLMAGCHTYSAINSKAVPDGKGTPSAHLQKATQLCNAAIVQNGPDYRHLLLRGYCYFSLSAFELSLHDLLQAEPLAPSDMREQHKWFIAYVAFCAFGEVWDSEDGSKELCLKHINLALSRCPYWGRLYFFRGTLLAQYQNDSVGALADYNLAIELQPDLDEAYLLRAGVYLQQLRVEEAMRDIELAFRLCNEPTALHYLTRAEVHLRNLEFQESVKDSTEALRIAPPTARAHLARAFAWRGLGHDVDATADHAEGIALLEKQRKATVPPETLERWKAFAATAEEEQQVQFFVIPPKLLAASLLEKL
jgi:tetratricopeptide (TPR) repeat protein